MFKLNGVKLKKIIIAAFILILSLSVNAQNQNFGIGIMIGEPTGISLKQWTGSVNAVDAGIAWSFKKKASLHIHADYLWHEFDLIPVPKGRLPLHFGIGGRIKLQDKPDIGVRIPVGLTYIVSGFPMDIFIEIVPILDLIPETDFEFNAALGARYYF